MDELKAGAFGVAMAEFLIKKNLSAVVELGLPCTDAHDMDDAELVKLTITHALYRELVRGLKALPLEDGSGESLLDATTIVMHTEFDRQPWLSVAQPAYWSRPGAYDDADQHDPGSDRRPGTDRNRRHTQQHQDLQCHDQRDLGASGTDPVPEKTRQIAEHR